MRIVFCDDDKRILAQLEKFLREFFQTYKLPQPEYAAYTCGEDLLAAEQRPEIAFLDVEMQGLSGIHAGARLQQRNPYIKIFILTSYPDYLDEAMKFHVFRYLSKPLDKNRLFRNMADALHQQAVDTMPVSIETKKEVVRKRADEVVMIEPISRKLLIHTADKMYESVQPMKYWEHLLKIGCFFRTHRSFIVNLKYVCAFTRDTVTLSGPDKATYTAYLTRRNYQSFKNAYMLYLEAMR